jgi:hypothetical protein
MGLFDDSARLFNQSFAWALGRYRPGIDSDPDLDSPPPDLDSLSVYIDDEGTVNVSGPISSFSPTDPIDVPVDHTYSPENNFIAQLNRTLTTVPVGGIILYPTYNARSATSSPRRYWFANILPRYQGRVRYPQDTPPGFVPCVGQVLRYADGSSFQVAELAPPVTTWGVWEGGRLGGGWGGGGFAPSWSYLPAVRYLQRVPEGWVVDPVVEGRDGGSVPLDEVKPDLVWNWWWGQSG